MPTQFAIPSFSSSRLAGFPLSAGRSSSRFGGRASSSFARSATSRPGQMLAIFPSVRTRGFAPPYRTSKICF